MTFILTPYVLVSALTANVALLVAVMAWRRRGIPGGKPLVLLMGGVALWASGAAFEYATIVMAEKIFWSGISYGGVVGCPLFFLLFALEYCRLDRWLTRRTIALLAVIPGITWLLALTNPMHGLIWPGITPSPLGYNLAVFEHGVWFWVGAVGYSYLMMVAGTILLLRTVLYFPKSYQFQGAMIAAAALAPWGVNIIYVMGFSPLPGLELTPMVMTFSGIVFAWNIMRFGLLDLAPVARDVLIEKMSDGMLVLDRRDRVVDLNPAARRLLGVAETFRPGYPVQEAFANWQGGEVRFEQVLETRVEIASCDTPPRYLEVMMSPINDSRGICTGRLVMMHDITNRKSAEEKLRELSLVDELTQLTNRRGFDLLATQQLKTADRIQQRVILIFADLDNLKWINDTLGHQEGDRALVDVANVLKRAFRASDIVARWGGDEFTGLVIETQDNSGEAILRRLEDHLAAHLAQVQRPYSLSVSAGLAYYDPRQPCSLEELLARGDQAMYAVKQAKKSVSLGLEKTTTDAHR